MLWNAGHTTAYPPALPGGKTAQARCISPLVLPRSTSVANPNGLPPPIKADVAERGLDIAY